MIQSKFISSKLQTISPNRSSIFMVEASIWFLGLLLLYFYPFKSTTSLCFYQFLGFDSCPGCGLGRALHYALHGDMRTSLQFHILGIPTLIILIFRIIHLIVQSYFVHNNSNGG